MSGIAGILRRDGRDVDPTSLERMARALVHRGPDGVATWTGGPVGLVHLALRTLPEDPPGAGPLLDDAAGLVLVFDGRVDDREALRAALAAAGERPRDGSDAELLLRAFAAWGEEAPARVVGDWAAALWDSRRRRLLLARDAMGARPLFRAEAGGALYFASEPAAILDALGTVPRANEGVVAEALLQNLVTVDETLFEGILRVLPAEVVVVDDAGLRRRIAWEPAVVEPREGNEEENAARFASILREAIRDRLRSVAPVVLEVSGGLDSSSVAVVAADLARRGAVPCPSLHALSLRYPGLDCDETRYFRAVTSAAGLAALEVDAGDPGPDEVLAPVRLHRLPPEFPPSAAWGPALGAVRERGVRVRLGGEGGDEWLDFAPEACADLLLAGRFGELRRRTRDLGGPGSGVFGAYAVRPLLPVWMRRAARSFRRPTPLPPWISPELASRTSLLDRVRVDPSRGRWATFEQAALWRSARCGAALDSLEESERQAARVGQVVRSPLSDRRLVEFALSLPLSQRSADGESKRVLRRALGGLLPDTVRGRRDKAEFSSLIHRAVQRAGGAARFDGPVLRDTGWVREEALRAAAREVPATYDPGDGKSRRLCGTLWTALALDMWYQAIFCRR